MVEVTEDMVRYLEGILEVNKTLNLTRIDSFEEAKILHIEDSLVALEEFNAAPEGLYGDLGTGGGFPGVPIALATGRPTILVDSVGKKLNAIESVLDSVGIEADISTYHGRIEDLAKDRKGAFSVLSARALSKLPSLLELSAPLLKNGGELICYKAKPSDDEIASSIAAGEIVGMELVSRRNAKLSDNETMRTILVYRKTKKSKIKLPRKVGLAQKQPLA